jgi:hypothetical protein
MANLDGEANRKLIAHGLAALTGGRWAELNAVPSGARYLGTWPRSRGWRCRVGYVGTERGRYRYRSLAHFSPPGFFRLSGNGPKGAQRRDSRGDCGD